MQTNPLLLDVSCAFWNDHSSFVTSEELLPIIKLHVSTDFKSFDCLTLCGSASSRSWISANLVKCLNGCGRDLDPKLKGINRTTFITTKQLQVKVSSNFDGFEYRFELTAFVKDDFKVGDNTVNIPALRSKYPYLAPIKPIVYSYADIDLNFGQSMLFGPRSLMLTSTGFLSFCFKCNTDDAELVGRKKAGMN